jgi:D-sedoheptulose 7-phosphate isomerase
MVVEVDSGATATRVPEVLAPDVIGTDVFARDALAPDVVTQYVVTPEPTIDALIDGHLHDLAAALAELRGEAGRLVEWGRALAGVLAGGGRLLVAGDGGSAAEASRLAGALVGRVRDDRPAYSAIALGGDVAVVTAIGDDYGFGEVFARQVQAHGRAGDVFLALSASGRTESLLKAVREARSIGVTSWALTGPIPNPFAELADDVFSVSGRDAQTVQELHLLSVHLLCEQVQAALTSR